MKSAKWGKRRIEVAVTSHVPPGAFPVGCAVRVDGATNRMRLLTLGALGAMGTAASFVFARLRFGGGATTSSGLGASSPRTSS